MKHITKILRKYLNDPSLMEIEFRHQRDGSASMKVAMDRKSTNTPAKVLMGTIDKRGLKIETEVSIEGDSTAILEAFDKISLD